MRFDRPMLRSVRKLVTKVPERMGHEMKSRAENDVFASITIIFAHCKWCGALCRARILDLNPETDGGDSACIMMGGPALYERCTKDPPPPTQRLGG